MANTFLAGQAEVAINSLTVPSSLLSEISVELTEGTRDTETLGGKFTQPTGVFDTAMVKFTMFLPSMDYLKTIFPDRYNDPSGGTQHTGNIIFNANGCATIEATPVNIHFTCDATDDNDVYLYAGLVQLNFNPKYNNKDSLSLEVTVLAQPDEDGNVARIGTGNLAAPSHFNAATMATVANS